MTQIVWENTEFENRKVCLFPGDHELAVEKWNTGWFLILNDIWYFGANASFQWVTELAEREVEYYIKRHDEMFGKGGITAAKLLEKLYMATATIKKPVVATKAPVKTATVPAKTATAAPAQTATPAPAAEKAPKTPKEVKSLTAEETELALDGNLEMREKKGAEDQKGLSGETGARGPLGRPIGLITGLPIQGAWLYLLGENHRAPEKPAKVDTSTKLAIPGSGKMTDKQLSDHMKADFPNRTNKTFDSVTSCRRGLQKGVGTQGKPLNYTSVAYNEQGDEIAGKGEASAEEATEEAPE